MTEYLQYARPPFSLLAFWGVIVFLSAIGEGAVRTFFNVYLDAGLHVAPGTIGTVMGLAQILPIAVALLLPPLMARWGTGNTLAGGSLGMALCLGVLAGAQGLLVAAGAYIGSIAAFTMTGTGRDLLGQELVIPRWRTTSQGVAMIGMALGWAVAGLLGGMLIHGSACAPNLPAPARPVQAARDIRAASTTHAPAAAPRSAPDAAARRALPTP